MSQSTDTRVVTSWGRVQRTPHQVLSLHDRAARLPDAPLMLPFGNGRSYGDSNLNPGGLLLDTRQLNRVIEFDTERGLLTVEAGVLLSDILQLCVPRGWFVAVVPGTQYITVGGAVSNDVHGKNHHRLGSFGNHVLRFELLRSDGTRRVCSPTEDAELFAATIGGLGLTGLITWVQLQLRPVASPLVDSETVRFRSLEEFFELSTASERDFEYTVSWIDCAGSGRRLGRGLFSRGNHAPAGAQSSGPEYSERLRRMPVTPPFSLVNSATLKLFNIAYFHRQRGDRVRQVQHYRPFFFPLDSVLEWNRIYGPHGFYQYQCVIPPARALQGMREMLAAVAGSGMGSFLAVLKQFGDVPSRGMLSFPMPGTTLALDFPNRGARVHRLFETLDAIVLGAGGRLYPAKDARMGPGIFKSGYPRWREFADYVDPHFSSGLWRRVMGQ